MSRLKLLRSAFRVGHKDFRLGISPWAKYTIAQIEMAHWATYIKLLWLELIYFREEDVRFESRRITIQFVQKFTTGLPLELLLPKINVITSSSTTSSKIRDLTLTL